jgi:hypothetical protein
VEAMADGEKLKLAKGKSMLVNFPGGAAEGMRLFKGKYDKAGNMNWVPMSDQPERLGKTYPTRQVAKEGAFPMFTDYGPANAVSMKFRDNADITAPAYIYAMMEANYNCRGRDNIYVELAVDANGAVEEVKTLTGKNACMRLAIEELVQTIPWETRELGGAQRFYFELQPEIIASRSENDNMFVSMRGRQMMVSTDQIEATMAEYMERERARNFVRNAFTVTELGMINCDRFAGSNGKMVASTVELQKRDLSPNSKVYMVFDELNSVVEARPDAHGTFKFSRVPEGSNVTLVALAYEPGEGPYISMQKAQVKNGKIGSLQLKKTSEDKLKQVLASL